ncbi:tumor necrosis factor receptor superfamily member 1A-like isoform X6 [Pseudorasbora parva]|uniref:tumor necrosis factor receptor superfamily member 1A-like isoform X6 n=1 Tax=Pseudorasbora parva TaxID=51549 RepID=UPI00351F7964
MFYYAPDSINYFFKGFFKGLLFVHHTQWFSFKESIHSFFCGIRSKDPVDREVMITNIITTIWHIQGQHTRKLPPFILIVLMAGVVTGQRSVNSKRDCLVNEYWSGGLCCDKCAPGYKLIKKCSIGMQSQCEKCSDGTYQDSMNYFPNCFRCQKCSKRHAVVTSPCTYQNNTVCGCQTGYRIRFLDGHLQQFRGLSWDCVPYSL